MVLSPRSGALALVLALGCAAPRPPAPAIAASPAAAPVAGRQPPAPPFVRVDPLSGGGAAKSAGMAALEHELGRAMAALGRVKPAPYYIAYHVHDATWLDIEARNGALVL